MSAALKQIEHIEDLRGLLDDARRDGKTVGFVPTMGYLHEGHRSLMREARHHHDVVVVSIFVNPLQFGANEDLDRYPRDLEGDTRACETEGVDLLFLPSADEMYPGGPPLTTVHTGTLTEGLCGEARPTHFNGVTTVVTKLFAIVGPCTAYFGLKDFQQYLTVKRMAADLCLPVDVVGCPIVREADGLAMSSRNAYLSAEERRSALVLRRALTAGSAAIEAGERDAARIRRLVANTVTVEAGVRLEYVEVRSASDLSPLAELEGDVVIAVAARVGDTRLIDNVLVSVPSTGN